MLRRRPGSRGLVGGHSRLHTRAANKYSAASSPKSARRWIGWLIKAPAMASPGRSSLPGGQPAHSSPHCTCQHPGVVAGLAISGIYDLAPLRDTNLNEALKFTDEEIAEFSPLRLPVDRASRSSYRSAAPNCRRSFTTHGVCTTCAAARARPAKSCRLPAPITFPFCANCRCRKARWSALRPALSTIGRYIAHGEPIFISRRRTACRQHGAAIAKSSSFSMADRRRIPE